MLNCVNRYNLKLRIEFWTKIIEQQLQKGVSLCGGIYLIHMWQNCQVDQDQPVHQLWPPEDHVHSTNFDLVFFHGLRLLCEVQSWKRPWTWRNDSQDCWAENWLPQDLDEDVQVLALSYDSCPIQCEEKGNMEDVSEFGKNILQSLVFRFWSHYTISNIYLRSVQKIIFSNLLVWFSIWWLET